MADSSQFSDEEWARIHSTALDEREGNVQGKLNMGNSSEALKLALKKAPFGVKDDSIKDRSTQLVVQVLQTIKGADIAKHVADLDEFQLDTLMKYVYRGFSLGKETKECSVLLAWHEQIIKQTGLGSIIRCMAERRNIV